MCRHHDGSRRHEHVRFMPTLSALIVSSIASGLVCMGILSATVSLAAEAAAVKKAPHSVLSPQSSVLKRPQSSVLKPEPHLANIRQLTFGGKNAEAYFSFDGDKLIFQSTNLWSPGPEGEPATSRERPKKELDCYQMYVMDVDSGAVRRVSTGFGATTCGYFFPGGRRVLYSSTHLSRTTCPPKPARSKRYRWPLYGYDIFSARVDGQEVQRLSTTPGYDAEATVSPDGRKIVFTSVRDGDLDLYTMNLDGTHITRLTHEVGYDGGAFFSPDSKRIVYRASHPRTSGELDAYQGLLRQGLVEPGNLEIFVMDADGSNKRPITKNGASNFAPYFLPDGRRIIFSSNQHGYNQAAKRPAGRPTFHLYLVGDDGQGLEQVTVAGNFNSFPMFSPDGTKLVWVSDRHTTGPGEFNIFLADWIP